MRMQAKFLWHNFKQFLFDLVDVFTWCELHTVGDAEYMGVHCHCRLSKNSVQHNVCRFAPNAREIYEFFAGVGYFAIMLVDKKFRERDNVFGFGVKQADGFDM